VYGGGQATNKGAGWSDIGIADWRLAIDDWELTIYNHQVARASWIMPLGLAVLLGSAGMAVEPGPDVLGTPDPALARLFTPQAVPAGTYLVYRSARKIEDLTASLRARDSSPAPGAWEPTRPEAHGAFGEEGNFDRARLARLFNGKRVTVVRGSLVLDGSRVAYTLVSPYPDPSLSAILDGTMVVEFRLPHR
jgi:hypothetical protein